MVKTCVVKGCKNRKIPGGIPFYSIPSVIKNQGKEARRLSEERRTAWVAKINRKNWVPTANSRVCSDHFSTGKPAVLFDKLSQDWVPTKRMGYDVYVCPSQIRSRYKRLVDKRRFITQRILPVKKRKQQHREDHCNTGECDSIGGGEGGSDYDEQEWEGRKNGERGSGTDEQGHDEGSYDESQENEQLNSGEGDNNNEHEDNGESNNSNDEDNGERDSNDEQEGGGRDNGDDEQDNRGNDNDDGDGEDDKVDDQQAEKVKFLTEENKRLKEAAERLKEDNERLKEDIEKAMEDNRQFKENIDRFREDNARLKEENRVSKAKCNKVTVLCEEYKSKYNSTALDEEVLRGNDAKLKFYTGLHEWRIFDSVFNLVESSLPSCQKISKKNVLLLFLVKLRLNLSDEDLAGRIGVHQTTISRNFHKVLDVMAVRLAFLIQWPDPIVLRATMPMSFRKFFKKCCVIIDCTEIFVERPLNLLARAQVWSHYKHHSTVKVLLGITPQGTISFVSECVGGRMSDKEIVEQSKLIDKLLPGDVILADRGFTCNEYAKLALAEVKTPPFTKGKKQLEKIEVDWSRELSIVRIHVERIIGLLKQKYTILNNVLPISLINSGCDSDGHSTISKIVNVCCCLINLCPPIVPQD